MVDQRELRLYEILKKLSIPYTVYEHEPAFTVEQSKKVAGFVPGAYIKNLFLKDNTKQLWLVVAPCDTKINLKELAKRINAPGLRFAQPELLEQYLGVIPGAVTPLALMHDTQRAVCVILDISLLEQSLIGCHPLRNSATLTLSPQDLLTFINYLGHSVEQIDVAALL